MRYITTLLLGFLLAGPLINMPHSPAPQAAGYTPDLQAAGYTSCIGEAPRGWVSSGILLDSTKLAIAVAVHEEAHVDQIVAMGGCDEYHQPENQTDYASLEMEAEAFYKEAVYSVEAGMYPDLGTAIAAFSRLLASSAYGFDIEVADAYLKIWSYEP